MRLNAYNGDQRLRADQAAAYLLLNALDNMRPRAHVDPRLSAARFVCPTARDELQAVAGTPSPSRAPCDLHEWKEPLPPASGWAGDAELAPG